MVIENKGYTAVNSRTIGVKAIYKDMFPAIKFFTIILLITCYYLICQKHLAGQQEYQSEYFFQQELVLSYHVSYNFKKNFVKIFVNVCLNQNCKS